MQKALSINLAGVIYSMNEDAYHALEAYFSDIKKHFSKNPDGVEIIDDIEHSVAEKFSQKLTPSRQVITLADVQEVMAEMGQIKDFAEEEITSSKDTDELINRSFKKKLFRDTDRQVIAGVCAGLATYFGIDIVWVRVLAVGLLFTPMNIFIIIGYVVLWISVPVAKNVIDKMEMQGEPINLAGIESAVKNKLGENSTKEETTLIRIILLPFRILASIIRVIKRIAPIFMKVIGMFALIGLIIFTTFVTTSAIATAFFPHIIKMPLDNFPGNFQDFSMIGFGYAAILIPLIFCMIAAVSLIKGKNLFNTVGSIGLFTVWMISIATAGLLFADSYPRMRSAYEQRYMNKKYFPVSSFTTVEIGDGYTVELIQADEYKVMAEGDKKVIEKMQVIVENNVLQVKRNGLVDVCTFPCFHNGEKIIITAPTFEKLQLTGGTEAYMNKFVSNGNLDIMLSGGSEMQIEQLTAPSVTATLVGSSYLSLQGKGENLIGVLSGGSNISASEFPIATAEVKLSGSSLMNIFVNETLKATLSGTSTVYYEGKPQRIEKNLTGSSEIVPREGEMNYVSPERDDRSSDGEETEYIEPSISQTPTVQ